MKTNEISTAKNNGTVTGATTTAVTAKASAPAASPQPGSGITPSKTFDTNPKPADAKPSETVKPQTPQAETKPQAEQGGTEPSKAEVREQLAQQKPVMNLDETLKLVAALGKKTALRNRYKEYIDELKEFEQDQKETTDELEDESAFEQCELTIRDSKGHYFNTKSPSVIKGTVDFLGGRFAERLAEVEAGIVLP